jgi:probable HAF family extracellular repeat protein
MMRKNLITHITALLCAALAVPVASFAQEVKAKPSGYIVKDMGSFGGPNSFYFSAPVVQSVNNHGTVTGGADTSIPDPYAPNCDTPDCLILHAFAWKDGVLTDLGTLPGGYSSTAYWVNDQGLIMGGSENGMIDPVTGRPENIAVVWRGGAITSLGTLGGSFSFGNAMNNRGQVVGLALNTVPDQFSFLGLGTETHAFIWQNGHMEDLGTLGGPDSWAAAVNERGQVAGWAFTHSTPNPVTNIPTQDPFLWQDGRMIDLGTLGGTVGVVGSFGGAGGRAVNNRGQVVGTSNLAGDLTHHPFLWNQGSLTDLGTLGGDNGEAYYINDAGVVVGRADVTGSQTHHAFRWEQGVMTDLGVLPGQPCSTALAVNSKGQIIIDTGICGVGGGPPALWDNGTLYDLTTLILPGSGVTVVNENFINDSGEIAATGILPNGDQHALLLIPVGKDDDNANSGAVTTQVVPAGINALPRSASRYGRFGLRTSAPE